MASSADQSTQSPNSLEGKTVKGLNSHRSKVVRTGRRTGSRAGPHVAIPRAQAEYAIGEKVERRDVGKSWGKGYATSLDPLRVTARDDDPQARGCMWDEVRPLVERETHGL